jgi:hydrogenase maturation protease
MPLVTIGIGTRLGRDDGIGLVLVERLVEDNVLARDDAVLLESADAAEVASILLELNRPAVIVDAADMGLEPGAYRALGDNDATLKIRSDATSTHGLGLAEGLGIARHLGYDKRVSIFAVQPFDLSFGPGLSEEMDAKVPELVAALTALATSGNAE